MPALYEKYVGQSDIVVVDEWTLCLAMDKNLATEMEEHYSTFIASFVHFFLLVVLIIGLDRKRHR